MEASGLPVGQVRFEKSEDLAEINYSLDKIVRNRRWAYVMLEMATKRYLDRGAVSLKAIVKSENHKSRSIFFKLGFRKDPSANPPPGCIIFMRICER